MEWKIYLKSGDKSYKALKIRQGVNFDITIIPKNSLYISKTIVDALLIGDQIEINYKNIGDQKVDHYSVHSKSGQRHIKFDPNQFAHEPCLGLKLQEINKTIPLITMVASANSDSEENPKGKWFGYSLPDDVNYIIVDIFAIPKGVNFNFKMDLQIKNDKKTIENFDTKLLEFINCNIVLVTRSTNHQFTDIPNNIIFQQTDGKTIIISRVEKNNILAQVAKLTT